MRGEFNFNREKWVVKSLCTKSWEKWMGCPALWIPAYAGMTVRRVGNDRQEVVLSCSPSAPVSGTGTGFDSSPIKGEGILSVDLSFLPAHPPPLWIAGQVRNDVTPFPALWILP